MKDVTKDEIITLLLKASYEEEGDTLGKRLLAAYADVGHRLLRTILIHEIHTLSEDNFGHITTKE